MYAFGGFIMQAAHVRWQVPCVAFLCAIACVTAQADSSPNPGHQGDSKAKLPLLLDGSYSNSFQVQPGKEPGWKLDDVSWVLNQGDGFLILSDDSRLSFSFKAARDGLAGLDFLYVIAPPDLTNWGLQPYSSRTLLPIVRWRSSNSGSSSTIDEDEGEEGLSSGDPNRNQHSGASFASYANLDPDPGHAIRFFLQSQLKAGKTYQVSIELPDSMGSSHRLRMGVDDFHVQALAVPEPSAAWQWLAGLGLLVGLGHLRHAVRHARRNVTPPPQIGITAQTGGHIGRGAARGNPACPR